VTLDRTSPEAIAAHFNVSRESLAGLQAYADLLLKWQAQINLIGPATVASLWWRHIADGLQLLAVMDATGPRQAVVVDLGSGGGVPGLVLAIARPQFKVHLVESNNKKAAFLREAARVSGISAQIHCVRIEQFTAGIAHSPDWVTARALAPMPKLLELAFPLLKTGRGLFHKGQDVDVELTQATKYWNMEHRKHESQIDSVSSLVEISQLRRRDGIDAASSAGPV
jgi:16S rRNA (guanine527-N7)-methyltransferase